MSSLTKYGDGANKVGKGIKKMKKEISMKKNLNIKSDLNVRKKLVIFSELLILFLFIGSSIAMADTGSSEINTASDIQKNALNQNDGSPELEFALENSEFIEYQKNKKLTQTEPSLDGHYTGIIPTPVDLSHISKISADYLSAPAYPAYYGPQELQGVSKVSASQAELFGPYYDLRALNKVTPVKDQKDAGTCWIFSTYASLESYLMPGENWDFSENNMKNLLSSASPEGFDVDPKLGGNHPMSTAYLARWSGPVAERDDPYDPHSVESPQNLPIRKHVQDVLFLAQRNNSLDNQEIKWAIMNYGAVMSKMHISPPNLNEIQLFSSTNNSYYYNGTSDEYHAVTIVGWNDSFDKNKFFNIPPGNGAFIVKNSWGTVFGENGYFYVSYYDSHIGKINSVFTAESPNNYKYIYQYDPLGYVTDSGYNNSHSGLCGNMFTAKSNEVLKAVSFYATDSNCDYEIKILNDTTTFPIQKGTIPTAGYHTVRVNSDVKLKAGEKFFVALNLTTPQYDRPIAIEEPLPGWTSKAKANEGESYFSLDGNNWYDISTTSNHPNANVCIKAFTDPENVPLIADFYENPNSGNAPLKVDFIEYSTGSPTSRNWDFGDGNNSTEQNPTNIYGKEGTYTVNLTVSNAKSTNSKATTITVRPVANFASNVTEGYAPLSVQFNDTSPRTPTSWEWNFSDGSPNSTEQNPPHTFTKVGIYHVTLTVMIGGVNGTIAKDIAVHGPVGAGTYAYIANSGSNTVSLIDTATDKVMDTVAVGEYPFGVACSPDGTKVYVTNEGSSNVSVIDTATTNVTASVSVGNNPYGVAVTPDGKRVYVANFGSSRNVSVIDTATNNVTASVSVGEYSPFGVAVTPDGTKVYVTHWGGSTVSVIDTTTNNVTDTVSVGKYPFGVACSPDGTKVYVTNNEDNNVYIIDTATNNVTATVSVGELPSGVAITPDGKRVYVANFGSSNVSVIDTATNNVTSIEQIGISPNGVAVTPDGTKIYMANSDSVIVIDTATDKVTDTVTVGKEPQAFGQFIVTHPVTNPVLPVANFTSNVTEGYAPLSVQFNDTSTGTPTSWEWNFGDGSANSTEQNTTHPFTNIGVYHVALTVMKDGNNSSITKDITVKSPVGVGPYAYITNGGSSNVSVIDTATDTVIATVDVGSGPYGVAIAPDGAKVYVSNMFSNNVSVIDTKTNNVTATVPVGISPAGVAITPDGTKVYTVNMGSYPSYEGTVSVIDTSTNNVTATVPVGIGPMGIAVTPDGSNVYVVNELSSYITVIDTATNNVTSVPVGINGYGIAFNPSGKKAYVTNYISNSVSVIDTVTKEVTLVPIGGVSGGVAVTPDGTKAYVTVSKNVTIINTADNTVITSVDTGSKVLGISVTPDGKKVYAANYGDTSNPGNTVSVIDTEKNIVLKNVTVGSLPVAFGQFISSAPVHGEANLYLSLQAPVGEHPSTSMTYTLSYLNLGNITAHNVVLEDELSDIVSFNSAPDGGVYDPSTRKVTWNIGSLGPSKIGYRYITVMTPLDVIVGTQIPNSASISTSDPEIRCDDNYAQAQTTITLPALPPNVSVINPHLGGISTPTVWWFEPTTFSYHSCQNATAVGINIHIDDGNPDIVANMAGGPPDWNYNTTFYPRYGKATVTYTISGCTPEIVSFDIYIDPAGHIYDIDTGKRIEGASVWLQRPDGKGGWEKVPTGQNPPISQPDMNPLTSDKNGMYQWDVLEGSYRVYVEAPGYEPANSSFVDIPPPVTDLHVGLHHINNFLPPASITNLQSTSGTNWINWTWINPTDPDLNHTEIYLNGIFQTNTSAEYFNKTDLEPETNYTIGTRTVDIDGNVNETWVNATAKTLSLSDTTFPVIESVILIPTNTTTGSTINVTVNATDNIGVISVNANDIPLINQGGSIWNGGFTALEGTHSVNVSAMDAASNIAWNNSASYTAVTPKHKSILVDDDGPADYSTIQAAVDNASSGDTIIVKPGIYTENINITKNNLTIISQSGEPEDTRVTANATNEAVFNLSNLNNISISGFRITGASSIGGCGIYLTNSEYSNISNNIMDSNRRGICLENSRNNFIINNNASSNGATSSHNGEGIYLTGSDFNNISNNNINSNRWGIYLFNSSNNILTNNTVSSNGGTSSYGGTKSGFALSYSSNNNSLYNNTASSSSNGGISSYGGTKSGFALSYSSNNNSLYNNTASSNTGNGFILDVDSVNNSLFNNTVSSNTESGFVLFASNNSLRNNTVSNNSIGIDLNSSSEYNIISGNNIFENKFSGLYISQESGNNTIFNNCFNNTNNTEINNPNNTWNISKTAGLNIVQGPYLGGNFWAEPDGSGFSENAADADKDGIADSEYAGTNFTDYLPLVHVTPEIPALLIVKTASPKTYSNVGEKITYTYNITNIGNVNIAGLITVTDNRTGSINITVGNLAPGKSANGTANYTITQEDLDNGSVTNEAFAKGTFNGTDSNANGTEVHSTNVIETVTTNQGHEDDGDHPAISIFKTVISPDEDGDCIVNSAGDTIPYRIIVKNEGNVDLTGVKADDPLISLPKPDGDDSDPDVLNPGETWVYTGVYKLTSKDVKNKNSIKNTAMVSCNELPDESSSVETPIVKKPGLLIYKSVTGVDETGDKIINEPGDIIEYQVAIKNNGNMDFTEVSVSDPMVELTGPKGDHDDQEVLSPGETWVYTGDYEVIQADINGIKNGHSYIKNTATISCNELSDRSSSYVLPIYAPTVIPPEVPPEIIIPGPKNEKVLPEANFRTNINDGKCPLPVQFTDLSQNAESRSWDFNNDGTADSYDMNPSYVYTTPGTYTAKLTVTNPNGTDYKTFTIKAWQPDSSDNKRNGHHGSGTGKAVIIRKNEVSDSNAGTGENGALTDNQNSSPGSKQDNGNAVKGIKPISEQKDNTGSPANE